MMLELKELSRLVSWEDFAFCDWSPRGCDHSVSPQRVNIRSAVLFTHDISESLNFALQLDCLFRLVEIKAHSNFSSVRAFFLDLWPTVVTQAVDTFLDVPGAHAVSAQELRTEAVADLRALDLEFTWARRHLQ